jgi:rhamnose transport system permease protein
MTHVNQSPPPKTAPAALDPAARPADGGIRWSTILTAPEVMTVVLLIVAVAAASFVPRFLDARYLFDRSSLYVETGIMAVAMTFVIIGGHIDLSCASILALVGALTTTLYAKAHVPFVPLLICAPLLGAVLGALNGVVVANLGLPSLIVTLATMAAYRGFAQVLIGDQSVAPPQWFTGIDEQVIAGTPIGMPLIIFVAIAIVGGLLLHRTVVGRWVYALGTSPRAALYAGVPTKKVTIGFFTLSGVLAAVAGMIMVSRLHYARWDMARGQGSELDVITAVVLGGTDIFGGRGTMFGTVVALALVAVVQTIMGLENVKPGTRTVANGALLIFALLATNAVARLRKK